jgi:hypothetical protein
VNGGWPPLLCFCNAANPSARAERGKKIDFYLEISKIFFIFFKLKNFKTLLGVSIRGLELQSWLSC